MRTESPFLDETPVNHDEDLSVRMAQNGDRESLEWLARRHSPWIYNIALRLLYHPDDAQDASQEILVKVITRLSTFEGRSSFRTWLYRVTINRVLLHFRKHRFGTLPPDDQTLPVAETALLKNSSHTDLDDYISLRDTCCQPLATRSPDPDAS